MIGKCFLTLGKTSEYRRRLEQAHYSMAVVTSANKIRNVPSGEKKFAFKKSCAQVSMSINHTFHTVNLMLTFCVFFLQYKKNCYGVHPFYMGLENTADANGVLLLNSNAIGERSNACTKSHGTCA